jgi:hypothetical protein
LLAIVILVVMLETMIVLLGCSWLIVVQQRDPLGACANQGTMIREVISEMITAVLALLVAGRPSPPEDKE